tara:strand:+ start:2562 stop:2786 length:225 start_codon:yes stop_codon:yes gene_type:complete
VCAARSSQALHPRLFWRYATATPCSAQTPQGFSIVTPNKQYSKLENSVLKSQAVREVFILILVENPRISRLFFH